jgi:beta-lactamase class A
MQTRQEAERSIPLKQQRPSFLPGYVILLLLLILVSVTLLTSGFALTRWRAGLPAPQPSYAPVLQKTVAINGADRWNGDSEVTAPTFDFSPPDTQSVQVSPLFQRYYSLHSGLSSLGAPVTVAFPTRQGWMQFFRSAALLLPAVDQFPASSTDEDLIELIKTGMRDADTGVIRLPLLPTLLTVGSQVPVGDDDSPLTYVDLRKAASPDLMVTPPVTGRTAILPEEDDRALSSKLLTSPDANPTAITSLAHKQTIFIQTGTRAGHTVGHLVPGPIWDYINRADVSPHGWQTDLGPPLTEALSFTVVRQGHVHKLLVQAFSHDGVVLDQSTLVAGQPQIQQLDTSVAYLRTFGLPKVELSTKQTMWTQGETTLLDAPSTAHALAHVGQDFPLTSLGEAKWEKGMLWYHVSWTASKRKGAGWVSGAAITFTSPGSVPSWASLDVLSPDLETYIANLGDNAGAVIYDVTRQNYYTYNPLNQFLVASSMKVPIMLTFLDMTEQEGREPTSDEMDLLTTMIENSNNDSASALYFDEIGGAAGVANYLNKIGITGLDPNSDSWGYSLITPLTMVNLLTLLYNGQILTPNDRQLALDLMEHIEPDQQIGVGDTAPAGAIVAMKDGWVPGPDDLWAMNSSGIVKVGQQIYIIAIYTQEQSSLGDAQATVQHFCGTVAPLLI